MKLLPAIFLHLISWFALWLAHFRIASFWSIAAYVWEHCDYVAQSVTGPCPKRSIYLRLVDRAIEMPHAESELVKRLSRNNESLLAYCVIALKRINRLDADIISRIQRDGLILVATGQFRVETNLKKFANDLMLRE